MSEQNLKTLRAPCQGPTPKKLPAVRRRAVKDSAYHLFSAAALMEEESERLLGGFQARRLRRLAQGIREIARAVDVIGQQKKAPQSVADQAAEVRA